MSALSIRSSVWAMGLLLLGGCGGGEGELYDPVKSDLAIMSGDGSLEDRRAAAQRLAGMSHIEDVYIEPLFVVLKKTSEDQVIRARAARALGRIKGEKAPEVGNRLHDLYQTESDASVKSAIVTSISHLQ